MQRLVLIDDDADGRELLAEFLRLEGFGVDECETAEDALESVWRLLPDAVLTDWHLGGMSGADCARRLRDDPRTRGIPIIAVTGRRAHELADERGLFDAVIVKPFDVPHLVGTLRALLTKGSSRT